MIRRSRVFWWRISCDARRARLFRYLLMVSPSPSEYKSFVAVNPRRKAGAALAGATRIAADDP
jgi:hypothetical protein